MKVSNELEKTFVNDATQIKSVRVVYHNGQKVDGFVKTAEFIPLKVTLCKHQVEKGENSLHNINFDDAENITVTYKDETERSFS